MYLKTVTLHGFKSFADPTTLDLQPGVTTIVGPNGCGKSNIADAIRWVLGEQSAKALRGGKMQDVIFQGSENRKPVPFCEVTLVFSDCEEALGTQFHEVEISRKVTRDGGSDYSLNGKLCRLKDILTLFMDTGIGQVSYSFLLQGQIDQILSSNPLERRAIFEEAAGITRYKTQRKESLNKLNLVEQNLTRVTDIIEEIGKRIGTLKRQASKAVRYERIRHRLKHLDLSHAAYQHSEFKTQTSSLDERLKEAEKDLESFRSQVQRYYDEIADKKEHKNDVFQSIEECRSKTYSLNHALESTLAEKNLKASQIENLSERVTSLEREIRELEESDTSIESEEKEANAQMSTQHAAVSNAEEGFRSWDAKLKEKDQALQENHRDIQKARNEIGVTESQINLLRSQSTRLEVGLESFQDKQSELSKTLQQAKADLTEQESFLSQVSEKIETKSLEKKEVQSRLESLIEKIKSKEAKFQEEREKFNELEKEHTQAAAEASVLESLQKKLEGFGAGTKAIFEGQVSEVVSPKEVSLFSKNLKFDQKYQHFIEALLGTFLESIVFEDPKKLQDINAALRMQDLGRASFVIPSLAKASSNKKTSNGPLKPASELITSTDSNLEPLLAQVTEDCYYCSSLEEAVTFIEANRSFDFELIATQDGEIVTRKGVVQLGEAHAKAGSFLQRQNELRELNVKISGLESNIKKSGEKLDTSSDEIDQLKTERNENRDILNTVEREFSNLETELKGIQKRIQTDRDVVQKFDDQLVKLDQEKEKSTADLSKVREKLDLASKGHEDAQVTIQELEKITVAIRGEKDSLLEQLSDAKVVLSEERQKLNLFQQTLHQSRQRRDELERRKGNYLKDRDQSKINIEKIKGAIEDADQKTESYQHQILESKEKLVELEAKFQKAEEAIVDLENRSKGLLDSERSKQDLVQKLSVSLSEKSIHLKNIIDKASDEYEVELSGVDWQKSLWYANQKILKRVAIDDLDDESDLSDIAEKSAGDSEPTEEDIESIEVPDWEQIHEEIHQLRTKIHSMGPVNTLAIEEYTDLKERFDFLKNQSDDLWNSKNQLIAAIDEINKTSEELFKDTFEKVRTNFKDTYNRLTGGGESDLQLLDADDILDSGIDIIARPPGTRLRNLSLLSGGQKTMTAVALLFAIYIVKPSPFCVLDELDAPLDDANIGRFIEILRDFTKFSQFLMVSHNKRTIAASDSIFGVTMEEKGVSKLVSMRFNSDRDLIEDMVEK